MFTVFTVFFYCIDCFIHCFDLSPRHFVYVYVCLSVCLSHEYGHTPSPIVMKFGIDLETVLGKKANRGISKGFYFSPVSKF